jgi:hypothetical protein
VRIAVVIGAEGRRLGIERILAADGHLVHAFASGDEVAAWLARHEVDAIVLDEDPAPPLIVGVPILFLDGESRGGPLPPGATARLSGVLTPAELRRAVRELVAQSQ